MRDGEHEYTSPSLGDEPSGDYGTLIVREGIDGSITVISTNESGRKIIVVIEDGRELINAAVSAFDASWRKGVAAAEFG